MIKHINANVITHERMYHFRKWVVYTHFQSLSNLVSMLCLDSAAKSMVDKAERNGRWQVLVCCHRKQWWAGCEFWSSDDSIVWASNFIDLWKLLDYFMIMVQFEPGSQNLKPLETENWTNCFTGWTEPESNLIIQYL